MPCFKITPPSSTRKSPDELLYRRNGNGRHAAECSQHASHSVFSSNSCLPSCNFKLLPFHMNSPETLAGRVIMALTVDCSTVYSVSINPFGLGTAAETCFSDPRCGATVTVPNPGVFGRMPATM